MPINLKLLSQCPEAPWQNFTQHPKQRWAEHNVNRSISKHRQIRLAYKQPRCWIESGRLTERPRKLGKAFWHFDGVRNRETAHLPGWKCGPSPHCLLWEITRRASKHPQTDPYPSGLMSLWLRVMWRDEWPRPTPSNTGVPGCEIACLIPSSISPSVTTKLPLPSWRHRPNPPPPPNTHPLRLTPNLPDRCGSVMCRPSNPRAEQYAVYHTAGLMGARQCMKWR